LVEIQRDSIGRQVEIIENIIQYVYKSNAS